MVPVVTECIHLLWKVKATNEKLKVGLTVDIHFWSHAANFLLQKVYSKKMNI